MSMRRVRFADGRKLFFSSILAFALCVVLGGLVCVLLVANKLQVDRLAMERLILEKTVQLTDVINRLLYKAETLSALVVENRGDMREFTRMATPLFDDPALDGFFLAPGGIVTHVYPLRGNSPAVGNNFFSSGPGSAEALLARDGGKLTFGGPFAIVRRRTVLAGWLPVHFPDETGVRRFWGVVCVALKFPGVLDALGLDVLRGRGFEFELCRYDFPSGEWVALTGGEARVAPASRYAENELQLLNTRWRVRLYPLRAWYSYVETWVLLATAIGVGIVLALVVQNNCELKVMRADLEELARLDPLTGIFNRRHFMETAAANLNHAGRSGRTCAVIIYDLDFFKQINDTHGHSAGDAALIEIARRTQAALRPYDLFARYGGEEFILLVQDVDAVQAAELAGRLRQSFFGSPFACEGKLLPVTASFGIAPVPPGASLSGAVASADSALYAAKRAGRNCVMIATDDGGAIPYPATGDGG